MWPCRSPTGLSAARSACRCNLRASKIIGERPQGERTLTDDELFALWRGAGRLGYPYTEVYRVLLLTGLRLNEVADASWGEFELPKKEWTIPAARMKGRPGKARPHLVPLTDNMLEILHSLPRFKNGDYCSRLHWVPSLSGFPVP